MSNLRDLLHPTDESPYSSPGSVTTPTLSGSASTTPSRYLTIEYIFDTICPHSYIGLRHLQTAIAEYRSRCPDVEFEVVFTPLITEPALYKPVYDRVGHSSKWLVHSGSSRDSHMLLRLALEATPSYTRSVALTKHQIRPVEPLLQLEKDWLARALKSTPAEVALQASLSQSHIGQNSVLHGVQTFRQQTPDAKDSVFQELVSSTPFTMPSPAMFPKPRGPSLQLSLAIALCRGYFERDLNIYNRDDLVDVAVRILGFSEAEIRGCLDSDDWARLVEILSIETRTRLEKIRPSSDSRAPVPTLIFQNKFVHPGWPKVKTLLAIFDDLREGRKPQPP